jgi:hypothetical protein
MLIQLTWRIETGDTVHIDIPGQWRGSTISSIRLHGTWAGPVVHWRLFCQIGRGASVEINNQKLQATDLLTRLYFTYRQYITSNRSTVVDTLDIGPSQGLTANHIISLLLHKGRDRYQLSQDGSGCRFWCETVIADLEGASYITSGSTANACVFLDGVANRVGLERMPNPHGTFY